MRVGLLAVACLGIPILQGAYLIEIDTDGLDNGVITYSPYFSFGGDTTSASQSVASSAIGLSGGDSIYGGNGVALPDTYVFTYTPGSQADNLIQNAGIPLGNGNSTSGEIGGAHGIYAVYASWPRTNNVSGGLTSYRIETLGDSRHITINQNGPKPSPNTFGDVWVRLGEVYYTSGAITVTQTAGSNSFVSMRAAGLLFELLSADCTGRNTVLDDIRYTGPPGPVWLGEGITRTLGIAFMRNKAAALTTHFSVVQSTDLKSWKTSDLKLVSVTEIDSENELVTIRTMTPMTESDRQFLAVNPIPKMPVVAPYIAITFDDGPDPHLTPRLLDILRERNIRGTFYVTGLNTKCYPEIVRRMINEGHEVGNHTMTHAKLTTLNDPEVLQEVAGCHDSIVAAGTLPPVSIRPPFGAMNKNLRELLLTKFGYATVTWDVDPRDWDMTVSDESVLNTILTETDPGEIILTHDILQRTILLMPEILDGLRARGFSFVTISEMLALRSGTP